MANCHLTMHSFQVANCRLSERRKHSIQCNGIRWNTLQHEQNVTQREGWGWGVMKNYVLLTFVFCSSAAFNHSRFIWPILSAVSCHHKPWMSHLSDTVSCILTPEAVSISLYCQLYFTTRSRQYFICPILSAVSYHQKPWIPHLSDTVSCILPPEAVNTSSDRYCQLYFTTRSREYLIWPILSAVFYHQKPWISYLADTTSCILPREDVNLIWPKTNLWHTQKTEYKCYCIIQM